MDFREAFSRLTQRLLMTHHAGLQRVVNGLVAKPNGKDGVIECTTTADRLTDGFTIQAHHRALVGDIVKVNQVVHLYVTDLLHESTEFIEFLGDGLFFFRRQVGLETVIKLSLIHI